MSAPESVRIDKWLWAVRIFKTRSVAADACHQGRVTINGHDCKPSREVRVNEVLFVKRDGLTLHLKVLGLIEHRVGAAKAPEFVKDQTSPAEYERARQARAESFAFRPIGSGRPSKKDRRLWARFVSNE